ncbi:MAG TPA: HAD-IC family P-type ATPase [Streptosporangiaceae bacterium]|nr:HAD-IC family P-type ATPase [Streptosporangiaceae bacterium]
MITGDHAVTAAAIARQLGIEGKVISGTEFGAMTDEEAMEAIAGVGVIARVTPEHKVRLVEILKRDGRIVAMTGDGVNDAPALKKADIGIAMGVTGTEVAKQAAQPADPDRGRRQLARLGRAGDGDRHAERGQLGGTGARARHRADLGRTGREIEPVAGTAAREGIDAQPGEPGTLGRREVEPLRARPVRRLRLGAGHAPGQQEADRDGQSQGDPPRAPALQRDRRPRRRESTERAQQVARVLFHERAQLGRTGHPARRGERLAQLGRGEVAQRPLADPVRVGAHRENQHHVAKVDGLPPGEGRT